jgi:pilus assembly protein CpaE
MPKLRLAIFAADSEQLGRVQARVNRTMCAQIVSAHSQGAGLLNDAVLQEFRATGAEMALVATGNGRGSQPVAWIEALHTTVPGMPVLAIGPMDAKLIVAVMRAGATEYLDENFSDSTLLDAFARLASSHEQTHSQAGERGRLYAVYSAKGGSGATTVAVNLAVAVKERVPKVALVDLATLGHTPLHLDARPAFGVADAVQNLHRLDRALLESFMFGCADGVRLLAGPGYPGVDFPAPEVVATLQLLTGYYGCVIVDCSTRCDATARAIYQRCEAALLVTQSDAISLWSAAQIREFLMQGSDGHKLHLVVNRYRATPAASDKDIEAATKLPVFGKIPNQFQAVSKAIERGAPAGAGNSELARTFRELAVQLLGEQGAVPDVADTNEKKERPNRILERLLSLNFAR